ncbi:MAG: DNA-binding transcriptional ArsR family regulator [Halobacteriales archaeon]|jgi:DNA-binding transcriptional ArsR family regulator
MCKRPPDAPEATDRMRQLQQLEGYAKALHCPTRWDIVDVIGEGTVTTDQIRSELEAMGYEFSRSGLYYHLSELRDAGIIEVAGYLEEGRGAPTKEWALRTKRIEIDLVDPSDTPG